MVHGNFHCLTAQPGHMFANKYQLNDLPTEAQAMSRAALLCLNPDPESRPPMSKVSTSLCDLYCYNEIEHIFKQ